MEIGEVESADVPVFLTKEREAFIANGTLSNKHCYWGIKLHGQTATIRVNPTKGLTSEL